MPIDKSLFPRLKALFSTDVIIRNVGGKSLKIMDVDRIAAYGDLQTNSLVDRFTRLHKGGMNMQYNPTMNYQTLRLQLYNDYEAMDTDPILSSVLDILSEECTVKGEADEVLSIRSTNENIQKILYNLFYDVLNIEFNLPMWIRSMCKYGDFYLHLNIAEKYGVYNVKPLQVYDIYREEGQDPNHPNYIRFGWNPVAVAGGTQGTKDTKYFENYEIAHFRLISDSNFLPYGKSYLEPARKIYKQYALMLDAMLLHRVMRAPEKRIFYLNIGNIPPNEVNTFMQNAVNTMKKTPFIDQLTGDYNLKFNVQNMLEDYYIPVRPGDTTTKIETAKGLEYTGIDDVIFLRDLMLTAIKVPKAFLNYSDELNGKSTISSLDIRFNRTIEKIQRIVVSELYKIAVIHLYTQGYEDADAVSFEIKLNSPSIILEQEKIALLKEKVALAGDIMDKKLFSTDWIADNIFHLSEDQISQERELIVYDVERAFRYSQIENEGNDPSISGQSYGTPHDLASIYKANSENKPSDLPDGYDEKDNIIGRPKEKSSIYKTDDSAFGRDPLGTNAMKGEPKDKRNVKVRPYALESFMIKNKKMIKDISHLAKKKEVITENTVIDSGLLDEKNIIDDTNP